MHFRIYIKHESFKKCFLKIDQRRGQWTNIKTTLSVDLSCRYSFKHGVMRDTLSSMLSCFLMSRHQTHMMASNTDFRIFSFSRSVLLFVQVFYE